MTLRIGIGTFSGQRAAADVRPVADVYGDVLSLARVADEAGFDSLWVSEHHGASDAHIPSPLVMLAAIAAITRRISLGTGIAIGPFQHPIRFAEDCAVVDQLSRGRLIVGIASGWRHEEFDAFGIPMAERAGRTTELVRILRAAWDSERSSFHGRYFSYPEIAVTPRPARRLPIVLGGSSPAAAARAGRLADGFTAGPQHDLAAFRALVDAFDAAARGAGRDPAGLAIGCQVIAWVSRDGETPPSALQAIWHKMGTSLRWHAGERVSGPADLPPLDEDTVRRRAFTGTPAQLVARLRPWTTGFAGREMHLIVRLHHAGLSLPAVTDAARLFAAEVMPALSRTEEVACA
ncbi:MAG: LLM class flavin-dependent oxidoreductase [Actinobacteria bacterium]|nr:LLM class flavin-dependent oxidoreductase [Actinomycetota bacterium]